MTTHRKRSHRHRAPPPAGSSGSSGPVVDVEFPRGGVPPLFNALHVRGHRRRGRAHADPRGRAAPRRRHRPDHLHAADRRPGPRRHRHRHRRADLGAGRRRGQGPRVQRARRLPGRAGHRRGRRALADLPQAAGLRPARGQDPAAGHRDQGHRPADPVRAGRQDRPVRRRRRRQDRAHPGDDHPGRQELRWHLGVRRGGGAHPRGQRPLHGDDRVRRHQRHRAGVRSDGRAAGHPDAGRAVGADDGRVLPRRAEPGRAAVHRQHLPVHPGRLRGLHAARPDAVRGGLPADAGRRDGRAAGADHLDQGPVDHLAAGDLRARRRLHRPGAGHHVRAPGRHHRAGPRRSPRRASTRR